MFPQRRPLTALAAVLAFAPASPAADEARRPNIVLMLTDDQRADCLGCAGHPLLKTPHIDRLAAEGARFQNAFVTTSICCVSRASLFTGRLCRNHRVGDFRTPLPPEVLAASFPARLKLAGYRTGCFGKWGIGGAAPREAFDVWDAWADQGKYALDWKGEPVHNSEYLARRAVEFLDGGKPGQPFCLVVLYKAPHDPFQPDARDAGLFRDAEVPLPPTATEEHFARMPPFLRNSLGRAWANRDIPTPEKRQEYVKEYLRCVAGVDRSVGTILAALDDRKLADDTLVVFSSDNGYFLGERGLIHKWLMYEESIRVPLVVRWPKSPAAPRGRVHDQLALNIDVAPTLLDFAGVPIPEGTDGHSLKPLLAGTAERWRGHFFYEHHYRAPQHAIPPTEGVRTADWKYIVYPDQRPPFEELYDLRNDPREERNLADDPGHAARLAELRDLYRGEVGRLPPPVLPSPPPKGKG
jgi:arylsulfatase A-like enzyme